MVNVTQFRRVDGCVTLEVELGSEVVQRRGWETGADGERRRVDGLLTLDEARAEQVRLLGLGYRVAAAG